MEQDEGSLHDPWIRVTDGSPEVVVQVTDRSRGQAVEMVHCHHCLLTHQLSAGYKGEKVRVQR